MKSKRCETVGWQKLFCLIYVDIHLGMRSNSIPLYRCCQRLSNPTKKLNNHTSRKAKMQNQSAGIQKSLFLTIKNIQFYSWCRLLNRMYKIRIITLMSTGRWREHRSCANPTSSRRIQSSFLVFIFSLLIAYPLGLESEF